MVTGDTKVVDAGHGDGVYINTAGIGLVAGRRATSGRTAREPGDVVIVSGDIGVHGVAVMSVREGLEFGTRSSSDCRAAGRAGRGDARGTGADLHVLRDPTRGGRGHRAERDREGLGRRRRARRAPVPGPGRWCANACALLGLDPLQVANEGKLLAFVPPEHADAVLAAMRAHPFGRGRGGDRHAASPEHPGMVVARTGFGGTRVVDLPIGEQLPADLLT